MPEDRLHPGNSIAAIEILARVGIVGHKARFPAFASTLFDRLGITTPIPALPPMPTETQALAQRLRDRQGGRGDAGVRRRHVGCREGLGRQELELIVRADRRGRRARACRRRTSPAPGASRGALPVRAAPDGLRVDLPGLAGRWVEITLFNDPADGRDADPDLSLVGPDGRPGALLPQEARARGRLRVDRPPPARAPRPCAWPIPPGRSRPGCAGSRCAASPDRPWCRAALLREPALTAAGRSTGASSARRCGRAASSAGRCATGA